MLRFDDIALMNVKKDIALMNVNLHTSLDAELAKI